MRKNFIQRNMHKVNARNQEILDQAKAHGLDLTELRKKYGLPFVIYLFKYTKEKSDKKEDFEIRLPPYKKTKKDINFSTDTYAEILENAGFKLRPWVQDFVDEDTGEVVGIQRYNFLPLSIA